MFNRRASRLATMMIDSTAAAGAKEDFELRTSKEIGADLLVADEPAKKDDLLEADDEEVEDAGRDFWGESFARIVRATGWFFGYCPTPAYQLMMMLACMLYISLETITSEILPNTTALAVLMMIEVGFLLLVFASRAIYVTLLAWLCGDSTIFPIVLRLLDPDIWVFVWTIVVRSIWIINQIQIFDNSEQLGLRTGYHRIKWIPHSWPLQYILDGHLQILNMVIIVQIFWSIRNILVELFMYYILLGFLTNFRDSALEYLEKYALVRRLNADWVKFTPRRDSIVEVASGLGRAASSVEQQRHWGAQENLKPKDAVRGSQEGGSIAQRYRVEYHGTVLPKFLDKGFINNVRQSKVANLVAVTWIKAHPVTLFVHGQRCEMRSKRVAKAVARTLFKDLVSLCESVMVSIASPAPRHLSPTTPGSIAPPSTEGDQHIPIRKCPTLTQQLARNLGVDNDREPDTQRVSDDDTDDEVHDDTDSDISIEDEDSMFRPALVPQSPPPEPLSAPAIRPSSSRPATLEGLNVSPLLLPGKKPGMRQHDRRATLPPVLVPLPKQKRDADSNLQRLRLTPSIHKRQNSSTERVTEPVSSNSFNDPKSGERRSSPSPYQTDSIPAVTFAESLILPKSVRSPVPASPAVRKEHATPSKRHRFKHLFKHVGMKPRSHGEASKGSMRRASSEQSFRPEPRSDRPSVFDEVMGVQRQKPSQTDVLTREFLCLFVREDKIDQVMRLFESQRLGFVTERNFVRGLLRVHQKRAQILQQLKAQQEIERVFHRVTSIFLTFLMFLAFLIALGVSANTIIITGAAALSASGVVLSFVYTDFIVSIILIVFLNPYSIGDDVMIEGVAMKVRRITTYFTEFAENTGCIIYYSHKQLSSMKVVNKTRSTNATFGFTFRVSDEITPKQYAYLRKALSQYLKARPLEWKPDLFIHWTQFQPYQFAEVNIWVTAANTWASPSIFPAKTEFFHFVLRQCRLLGLTYKGIVTPVEVKTDQLTLAHKPDHNN